MVPVRREEFSQLLNDARISRNVSIRGAAAIAGVPPATVQGWLNGRHFPTPSLRSRYLALAEYLGVAEEIHPGLWTGKESVSESQAG